VIAMVASIVAVSAGSAPATPTSKPFNWKTMCTKNPDLAWLPVCDLLNMITNIQSKPGPTGPTGPAGANGKDGAQGPAGPAGAAVHFGPRQLINTILDPPITEFVFTAKTDGIVTCMCYNSNEGTHTLVEGYVIDSGTRAVIVSSSGIGDNLGSVASITMPVAQGETGVVDWHNCEDPVQLYWRPLIS
jgi:hypothetical protein